jgi:hypothetical protein
MAEKNLAELCGVEIREVKVDGRNPSQLNPYITSDELCNEAGLPLDSARFQALHEHCQYSKGG